MKEVYKGCDMEVTQDRDCIFFDATQGKKIICAGVNSDRETTFDQMVDKVKKAIDEYIEK
jgi:hypothetical protein